MSTTNHYKKFYKTDRPKPPDSWYPTEIMEQKDTPKDGKEAVYNR
jgi:hypothetical protein